MIRCVVAFFLFFFFFSPLLARLFVFILCGKFPLFFFFFFEPEVCGLMIITTQIQKFMVELYCCGCGKGSYVLFGNYF